MNETDEHTGMGSRSVHHQTTTGTEEEEPPGKPRRHPIWRNVPDYQWDDWRWQSQNAIRSVRQLRNLLPLPRRTRSHRRLWKSDYKLAISALLLLADRPRRSQRSDPAAVRPLAAGDTR